MARSGLRNRLARVAARVKVRSENPLRDLKDAELEALLAIVNARQAGEPDPTLPDGVEAARVERMMFDMAAYLEACPKS